MRLCLIWPGLHRLNLSWIVLITVSLLAVSLLPQNVNAQDKTPDKKGKDHQNILQYILILNLFLSTYFIKDFGCYDKQIIAPR